jgi:hypothetical protein
MAVLLRESSGGPAAKNVPAKKGSVGAEHFASYGSYRIEKDIEYVLSISIATVLVIRQEAALEGVFLISQLLVLQTAHM